MRSRYTNLTVWQKSRVLTTDLYRLTRTFPKEELFGLTQQLRKAAVSVVSNIAEGHGRQGPAETIRFLIIARGSLFEIESQIIVAGDLLYLNQEETANTCEAVGEIIRMLNGLIRRYESTRK